MLITNRRYREVKEPTGSRTAPLPYGDFSNMTIVDVGCGDGWIFGLTEFSAAKALIGIERNIEHLKATKLSDRRIRFHEGVAERLLLPDESVDMYMSFVALPYTDIPAALREAHRVLRNGGRIHLSMHDWRHQLGWLWQAMKALAIKRTLDHGYVLAHSAWLALTGKCFGRPWKPERLESFQTQHRMKLLLEDAGFFDVRCKRTKHHFIVEGRK